MRFGLVLACLSVAACASGNVTKSASDPGGLDLSGPVLQFPATDPIPVSRANQDLARDFLDLEFQLESGLALPVLTRFQGPIALTMEGAVPPTARAETEALMARLRAEAGLQIDWGTGAAANVITLSFQPSSRLRRMEPTAACFVVPNVAGLADWTGRRGSTALDWGRMSERHAATLFLPQDAAPQELRDCLHEEMAQALGPVNDLYRLPDSVFNDDNFQSVLTEFDMLMLRLHYAPELSNGMGAAQVAALLPGLLARENPRGEVRGAAGDGGPTPRVWIDSVAQAMSASTPKAARIAAAERVLSLALEAGWQDNRAGFAWFLRGRVLAPSDPAAARDAYAQAARIYETLPDGGVHLAHALMQLAALDLARGDIAGAGAGVDRGLPLAHRAQNAALIATFQMIKAEILMAQGQAQAAEGLRLDTLPAARYGFGSSAKIRARAAEIAAIARLAPAG
ncbi:DUF2927 domain-containing protein [Stagnihabitans tardus]|uniref:DUF2927 domain-containing protein n=1 Tax=Stagnihabitans tardus TaxID=2699202 RepID=A0AAE4Y9R5_9RHOB|nr:DUF2927 domain-containing protein [Stagnihabitans tardus]NBZ87461.1 DUF2927 domain-containing protein [Stagnihabitans tardus]